MDVTISRLQYEMAVIFDTTACKNISMNKKEYTDIVRLVDVKQLNAISANFEIQVRFFFKSQNINC